MQSPAPAAVDPASIELHFLDARFVPASAPVSADGQVLWATGDGPAAEIWRYVPGASAPERIYSSPRKDGHIDSLTASSAGYAFIEQSDAAYGRGGWGLWLLVGPGRQPVEVDRGRSPGAGVAPTVALDARHLAWAAFDEPPSGPISRLRFAPVGDPSEVTTLIEASIRDRKLWFPSLAGNELWYAAIKPDVGDTGAGDEFHLEHLDLANPSAGPVRFQGRGNDFSPAVNDRFIVWKTTAPGDAALNWGSLRVQDRSTQDVHVIPVDRANGPSIGERFVAFDEITRARLLVYDLATGKVIELAHAATQGTPAYGGASLSGSLLTFFEQDGAQQPRIGWAMLPS